MTSPQIPLSQLLAERSFWIYTDGSAVTTGVRSGSYAAMILEGDEPPRLVAGACSETTINRMELLAINAAIWRISEVLRGAVHDVKVTVVTDSQVTERSITGVNRRSANLDLWASFDMLVRDFGEITVIHSSRNTEAPQAQADAICDICRKQFDTLVSGLVADERFAKFEISRPPEPARPKKSKDIEAILADDSIPCSRFDEAVHEVMAGLAAGRNNDGKASQIALLAENGWSVSDIIKLARSDAS